MIFLRFGARKQQLEYATNSQKILKALALWHAALFIFIVGFCGSIDSAFSHWLE